MESSKPEHGAPVAWDVRSTSEIADCRVFRLLRKRCRHPMKGVERDFFAIDSPGWVNVIALTPDLRMALVRQFRFGIEAMSLEIPGGLIDGGEDPVAAAVRELREETGLVGSSARIIGAVRPNPAIMHNICYLALVEEAESRSSVAWDGDEEIELVLADVEQALRWSRDGTINHSIVLNAFYFFLPEWEKLKAKVR